ncbi:hypothetical protein PIB30_102679, partial [Stylosanthes scabra]|nr:hypothetical protein [Stylosanthes scabra]
TNVGSVSPSLPSLVSSVLVAASGAHCHRRPCERLRALFFCNLTVHGLNTSTLCGSCRFSLFDLHVVPYRQFAVR